MTVTLITSASFVDSELAAEFGHLPPSFLPVGHKRLYDLQIDSLTSPVYLTLPQSFAIPEADAQNLERQGAIVIRVPDGLSLGNSVLYALEIIGVTTGAIHILHGDTLIYDLPAGDDLVAMGEEPDAYNWGAVPTEFDEAPADPRDVLAGYFAFADAVELRRALAMARGDFVDAVSRYGLAHPLKHHKVSSWLDCGHLQTYYRSRCSMRIQRSFNDLAISFQVVEKRSSELAKISAEAAWFNAIPSRLRLYTPAFLGTTTTVEKKIGGYAIEYLPMPSLHELFVFGAVSKGSWQRILEATFAFMNVALEEGKEFSAPTVIRQLTTDKTAERLDRWLSEAGISKTQTWRYAGKNTPTLGEIAKATGALIDMDSTDMLGIMHGDLCFTNIFFDFRTQRVKVIDPRGTVDGQTPTPLGDLRYDMAKLNHSIVGAYDFILADRFTCTGFLERDLTIEFPTDSSFNLVNSLISSLSINGRRLSDPEITAITVHLFLSMLPLHSDRPKRQQAFVANALRLFAERIDS